MNTPQCSKCKNTDRMVRLPVVKTDFGGYAHLWVCRRCGIVALLAEGNKRPD